jgi:cysteine desulfurase/selenocysteine lyase
LAISDFREEFPVVAKVNYLNTAGVGLIPRSVVEKINWFYRRSLESPPYEELFDENARIVENVRTQFAGLINASPSEVSFQPNTSTSISNVVGMIQFKRGDNAIIDDLGFPSVTYPVLALRRQGVEVRILRSKKGYVSAEDYAREMDERTRLVNVTFVSWINGMRADVEAIGKLAQEHGAYLLIDATHGAGYLRIDVERWKAHFVAMSNYKWLLSPFGASEFYVSRRVLDDFEPLQVGWHSVEEEHHTLRVDGYELPRSARKFEPGNPDYAAIYGLGESLRFLEQYGVSKIEEKALRLSGLAMKGTEELGMEVLTPSEEKKRSAILFARAKGLTGKELTERLRKRGVWVSPRQFGKLSGVRITPYFYNTEEDVDDLLKKLREIVRKR